MSAEQLISDYYAAFNAADTEAMLGLLHEDVVHDINQGQREAGIPAFRAFMQRMNRCYCEERRDIVVMAAADGSRGAAEFIVHGEYIATDDGLPQARGQRYVLRAGAFFDIRDERIARVTNYYNMQHWAQQVQD
jgi:steroid delta-isomerase-like uncharacterized protein